MTPEGKVKRKVSNFLKSLGSECYYFMPVQMGYGASALDYMGAYKGRAFAIETKAFGKKPTSLQNFTMQRMEAAGMRVWVVSCDEEIEMMKTWFVSKSGGRNAKDTKVQQEGNQGRSRREPGDGTRRAESGEGLQVEEGQEGQAVK